ncbi:glycosyltransferase family 4 protein [Gordonia sp. TBRC 11910]|uniref:Glycosyltransferase family 4 protein n=1 Tax=Gordonia asplenii TaxID=2725283 RepID=A0A848KWD0_9ACTN|nr:glycosyltransferase family 4 protein [Gordonia asplenii]NMO02900.1 glycosyltransferase family 4 protein [Gordonia asplenii]
MTSTTVARPLRILAVGPGPASPVSRGGMATVMTEMIELGESPSAPVKFTVVATYLDLPRFRKRINGVVGMLRSTCYVAAGRADLLHIHLSHGGSIFRKSMPIFMARLRGVPVVIHAHSYNFAAWYRGTGRPMRSAVRAVLRGADRWLILGNDLAVEYTEVLDLDPKRVQVLHNPAPAPSVTAPDPHGPVVGVGLGRLGQRKGTYDIIDAVRRLDEQTRARIHIVLAGDDEVEQARAAAADLDCVEIRDWIGPDERDELLSRATFFLLPSYDEGLPMALLEALAAGLVPIVTPVGAIADVVTSGNNGYLVTPGDTAAIADAIAEIVADPAHTAHLSAAAAATADDFSLENWHAELLKVWTEVLAER